MYGLGLDKVARDGAVPRTLWQWGAITTPWPQWTRVSPGTWREDSMTGPPLGDAVSYSHSEWPAGEGAEEDKLQGHSSPAPWNSYWCYPLEDPSWSQRERELTGVVHRGQSPRSQSRVEKALEQAKGRIQHDYDLAQGTQSNGSRLTHKQVSFSTHSN